MTCNVFGGTLNLTQLQLQLKGSNRAAIPHAARICHVILAAFLKGSVPLDDSKRFASHFGLVTNVKSRKYGTIDLYVSNHTSVHSYFRLVNLCQNEVLMSCMIY